MQANIKQIDSINQDQCVVLAQITHAPNEDISDNFGAIISASCDREYIPVAGASTVIQAGKTNSFVRTIVQRAKNVMPIENSNEMTALSANMYMDKNKRMWAVRRSESGEGDVLIRTSDMNDSAELMDMIRSVSNVNAGGIRGTYPDVAKAYDVYNLDLSNAQGGDMVSYVSQSGELRVGFVVAEVQDGDDLSYQVMDKAGNSEAITALSMVSLLSGDEIDGRNFPQVDSISAAGNATVQKLLDYYKQVFSYRPDYYEKLATIIRNHGF